MRVMTCADVASRRVLHVQSISCWAPSCIGPYSQVAVAHGLAFFAGQIGLDPPTMQLVQGGLRPEAARCLVSCHAVAVAVRCDLPQAMLGCTVYAAPTGHTTVGQPTDSCASAGRLHGQPELEETEVLLTALLRGDMHALSQVMSGQQAGSSDATHPGEKSREELQEAAEEAEEDDVILDTYLQPPAMSRAWQPLVTYAVVSALPRGAAVEVQPVALSLFGQDPAMVQGDP